MLATLLPAFVGTGRRRQRPDGDAEPVQLLGRPWG